MNFSPDTLSNIFRFLALHDLHTAGKVSRSWQQAAKGEYSKRRMVQPCLFVPGQLDICKFLASEIHATLLFYDERDNKESLGIQNPVYTVEGQHWKYKNPIFRIPIHKVMINTMKINTFEMDAISGLLGLYLPIDEKIDFLSSNSVVEFLGPVDKKSAFFLFGQFSEKFMNEIKLRCRKKGGNSTLWGGYFFHPMTVDRKDTKLIGIRLRDVDSWSIVLNYNYDKTKFDQKLIKLYELVKGRRNTLGLLCGRILFKRKSLKRYTNVEDIMQKIKMIFKKIPIIGIFSRNASTYYYGIDSLTNDGVREIKSDKILSLIIISYN